MQSPVESVSIQLIAATTGAPCRCGQGSTVPRVEFAVVKVGERGDDGVKIRVHHGIVPPH